MNPVEFASLFTQTKVLDSSKIFKLDNRYFLGDETIGRLLQKPTIRPDYFGTYLGVFETRYKPSFFLLEMLLKHSKKAVINDKSAWLFLCGRDVLKEGIVRMDKLENKDYVMVLNEARELLGYGYVIDSKIHNLLDRGDFLRRERGEGQEDERHKARRPGLGGRDQQPAEERRGGHYGDRNRGRDRR